MSGESDNVYMSVPGTFSKEDIERIGKRIDPMIARVKLFSYATSSQQDGDGPVVEDYFVGINYEYEITDDFYVIEAITNNREMPADRENALELKLVCEDFINKNITDGMTDYEKELAIHDYIVNNCDYSFSDDNDRSEFKSYGVLVNHKAVCEGYARATAMLLRCCGIEANLVNGDANSSQDAGQNEGASYIILPDGKVAEGHSWVQAKIDGNWYNVDTTWDDPLSEEPCLTHTYFNVSDDIISQNHTWVKDDTEPCNSMTENYYIKNNIYFEDDTAFKDYIRSQLDTGNRDQIVCAFKKADLTEEGMSFIFDYEGIENYLYSSHGVDGYTCIELDFNTK